jgi:dephospho-CoA kinase
MDETLMTKKCVRLGLTGGIGSGKSTVAAMLAALGATVIDADAISRASTAAGGIAIEAIRAAFGTEYVTPDGALDRDRMRALVFSDPAAKARLEAIVHPIVHAEIDRQLAAVEQGVAVLDLPLLVESPTWRERCDLIWVVDCAPETQIQRVMQRNGWPRAQIESVLAAQASRTQRRAIADCVIANDGATLIELQNQIDDSWTRVVQRFGL